jgi:hypothetical protein
MGRNHCAVDEVNVSSDLAAETFTIVSNPQQGCSRMDTAGRNHLCYSRNGPTRSPWVRPFARTCGLIYCAAFADVAPARVYVIVIASFRELASGPISIFITNELGFQSE